MIDSNHVDEIAPAVLLKTKEKLTSIYELTKDEGIKATISEIKDTVSCDFYMLKLLLLKGVLKEEHGIVKWESKPPDPIMARYVIIDTRNLKTDKRVFVTNAAERRESKKALAFELRRQGKTYEEISRDPRIDVNTSTLYAWGIKEAVNMDHVREPYDVKLKKIYEATKNGFYDGSVFKKFGGSHGIYKFLYSAGKLQRTTLPNNRVVTHWSGDAPDNRLIRAVEEYAKASNATSKGKVKEEERQLPIRFKIEDDKPKKKRKYRKIRKKITERNRIIYEQSFMKAHAFLFDPRNNFKGDMRELHYRLSVAEVTLRYLEVIGVIAYQDDGNLRWVGDAPTPEWIKKHTQAAREFRRRYKSGKISDYIEKITKTDLMSDEVLIQQVIEYLKGLEVGREYASAILKNKFDIDNKQFERILSYLIDKNIVHMVNGVTVFMINDVHELNYAKRDKLNEVYEKIKSHLLTLDHNKSYQALEEIRIRFKLSSYRHNFFYQKLKNNKVIEVVDDGFRIITSQEVKKPSLWKRLVAWVKS